MQASLVKLRTSTSSLQEKLRQSDDTFLKYQESSKEQKEQRQKEIEDLKSQQNNKKTERKTRQDELETKGAEIAKIRHEEHNQRKVDLGK